MIYLLRTKYYNCTLLKIGYTRDNNFKNRINNYKLHNPMIEVLYKILGGDEVDEANLHYLFRNFIYPNYGKEWFYEDQSIYDFFDTNKTKQDLDNNLPKHYRPSISSKEKHRLIKIAIKLINRWLCISSDNIQKLNENYNNYQIFISDCKDQVGKSIKTEDDIITYLSVKYNISEEVQEELLNPPNSIIVREFIEKFKESKDFPNKMKLLCETDLTDLERGVLLDQLPLTYKNYYETLGPERCKALGYNKTDLEKEYSDLQFDKSKLVSEIYKEFLVGSKYSKSDTKEKLKLIYSTLGYNKTPKANDLEEYFELKSCQITNKETGKRDMAFEIIKIKEKQEDDICDKN